MPFSLAKFTAFHVKENVVISPFNRNVDFNEVFVIINAWVSDLRNIF